MRAPRRRHRGDRSAARTATAPRSASRAENAARARACSAGRALRRAGARGCRAARRPRRRSRAGLLCTNPPYGVRLEDQRRARACTASSAQVLRERFQGWNAGGAHRLAGAGQWSSACAPTAPTLSGTARIECRLLRIKVRGGQRARAGQPRHAAPRACGTRPGARMFGNRLGKNLKRLRSWAQRERASPAIASTTRTCPSTRSPSICYRTLEPERAVAVRAGIRGAGGNRARSRAPAPRRGAVRRCRRSPACRRSASTCARGAATSAASSIEKVDEQAHFHLVMEGGLKFRVNFDDYLDTGLFLDHRMTRARLRERGPRQALPESIRLHRHGHVYAAAGGAACDHHGRHVAHLPGVGAAQPRPSTASAASVHAVRAGRLPRMARGERAHAPRATTWSFSIRRRSRTPSAWRACSTSSAITRNSSRLRRAARARRTAGVFHQRAALSAR